MNPSTHEQPFRIPAAGDSIQLTGMRRHAKLSGAKRRIMKVRPECLQPLSSSTSSPALLSGAMRDCLPRQRATGSCSNASRQSSRSLGAAGRQALSGTAPMSDSRTAFFAQDDIVQQRYNEALAWHLQKIAEDV